MVDKLFGVKLQTKLKCEETEEEYTVSRTQPKCSNSRSAQHGSASRADQSSVIALHAGHHVVPQVLQAAAPQQAPADLRMPAETECIAPVRLCWFLYIHIIVAFICLQETSTAYSLKCNISQDVNYLHQGITLGLVEDRWASARGLRCSELASPT